jgi:antitoxin MazE
MQVTVKKWGNSPSVRIPAAIMKATHLQVDSKVDVREEDGRIIIEPVRGPALADLLAGITPDNLHGEADFGGPAGNEIL